MKKNIPVFALLILFSSYMTSFALDGSVATIEFASGDDVLVIRSGRRLNFTDPFGLELLQGDQVQTGRGVFVELRLTAGGAVIKLAENTTFRLETLANGETSLSLIYGRVRAKVDKLAGTDSFTIRSATSVAGVRGTDFGIDVIARQQAETPVNLTRTYVFEGTVAVTALVRSSPLAAEGLEPIPREYTLKAGEMVVVSQIDTATEAEQTTIQPDILKFWSANDFSTIDVPSILETLAPKDSTVTKADTGVDEGTALPAIPSDMAADALKEAFDRGYSTGYPAGYQAALATVPEPAPSQEPVLPEGIFLSIKESLRIKQALKLQKGGIVAGSLLVTAAAGLAGGALWQLESGNPDRAMDNYQLAAIMSVSSLPFFLAALLVRP